MKKIKILFFHFDLGEGGAERVLVNLLNNLDPDRYDITLRTIFTGSVNYKNLKSHITFKPLFHRKAFRGMRPFLKLFPAKLLNKILIKENFDIQIAYLEGIPTRIVGATKSNSNQKKFAWVHVSADSPSSFTTAFKNYDEFKKVYNNFNKLAFVSRKALLDFEYYHKIDIPKEVVHNVNEYDSIRKYSEEILDIELNSNVINLCSVGRMTKQKRFDRLLDALAVLKCQGYNDWHLYLLGKGELEIELKNKTQCLELSDNITFLGFKSNPYKYVKNMDLFICSSEKEGFSTAVSESIFLGTPVLTTDCAGMEEMIINDINGFITENSTDGLIRGLQSYFDFTNNERKLLRERTLNSSYSMNSEASIKEFENFIS